MYTNACTTCRLGVASHALLKQNLREVLRAVQIPDPPQCGVRGDSVHMAVDGAGGGKDQPDVSVDVVAIVVQCRQDAIPQDARAALEVVAWTLQTV